MVRMDSGKGQSAPRSRVRFVFYDASGRRWTRVCRGVEIASLFLGLGAVLFLLSVMTDPRLAGPEAPTAVLPSTVAEAEHGTRGILSAAAMGGNEERDPPPLGSPSSRAPPLVFGYYVNWDRASLVSLRKNLRHLTHLVPQWLTLRNELGDLEDTSDEAVASLARQAGLPIIVMVTNYRQGWQAGELRRLLRNAEARRNLVQNIRDTLVRRGFGGVNIDFEQAVHEDRDLMTGLMRELAATLRPAGLLVTQSVPPDDPAYDVKALAAVNDYIMAMVYDEHDQTGSSGPIASQPWFEQQLARLATTVPGEKTIIGLGNYGYDWTRPARAAAVLGFAEVMAAATLHAGVIEWDRRTQNPVLRYRVGGLGHEVWFLDAVTALNQTRAVARGEFRGVALWRLGAEDPGLWTVLTRQAWPGADADPRALARVSIQTVVAPGAGGEVRRVVAAPRPGSRSLWRTENGDAAERYEEYPCPYVVEGRGPAGGNVIALTFDDGPDPRYTPQILDTLREHGVAATFFVVGVNAESAPGLLRRMQADGHEVGNHTYQHPNLATVSRERTRLELNATQRIIQHVLGLSTTLFRPPFNVDSDPLTPEEIEPILRAQELGYLAVGAGIDPQDWRPGITADAVVAETVRRLADGRIVLLHDGGGERSATVAALPRIIEHFRARGYRFATVSELIGKRRDEVMPSADGEGLWARIAGAAFTVKSHATRALWVLLLAAIGLALLRSGAYGGLAVWQKTRSRARRFEAAFRPPVSVIVPARNEERVIVRTVESLLNNGYPQLEVVIVDDGSTDRTVEVLQRALGGDPRVRVHRQARRGKAAALNIAVRLARHELLIAVDADTVLRPGTIEKLVRHFADPSVGAVSGNVRVGNRRNWITRFQSIEYVYGFNLDRRALEVLNAITVVPGAAGAWRKRLIGQLGGFSDETLAEDTDLTLAIRRLGYRIRYDEEAVAYTEAPEDARSLARQRFRWTFGTLQAAWKHRDATCRPRYGSLGFVALPSIWLFQLGLTLLAPVADVAVLIALATGTWRVVLVYYLGLVAVELVTGLLAYALEEERPGDLVLLPVQRIYYRQFMHYVLGKVIVMAVKGRLVGWGKLERRGACPPLTPRPDAETRDREGAHEVGLP